MTAPTIPTVAGGRVAEWTNAGTSPTRTFANLNTLTKNSGDLLIAIVIAYNTSTGTNAAFSGWGGGFTEFHDSASNGTIAIGMAYKWSDGTETGAITVTQAGTITGHAWTLLLSIPGAEPSTAPEAGSRASGTSAAADPASFNPSWGAEDTLFVAVGAAGETSTTGSFTGMGSAPTNYGDYFETGLSGDVVGGVDLAVAFRQLNADSENVGPFSVDVSNARNAAVVLAVRGISGPPPPADLADGTHVEPESHGYCPVIIDSNGNLYTITESLLSADNQPRAMKSTDRGVTWVEQDAANRPATDTGSIGDLESSWITWRDGLLIFTWQRSYSVWSGFRTSDHPTDPDTWVSNTREEVSSASGDNQFMSHTDPTDQAYIWLFMQDGLGSVYLSRSGSGSYGTQQTLDAAGISPSATIDAADVSHILYKNASNQLQYRTLTSGGTLSGAQRVDTNGTNAIEIPHTRPIPFTSGGDDVVTCIFGNATGQLRAVDIVNGTVGSEQTITNNAAFVDPGDMTNLAVVVGADVDGDVVHCFWGDAATGNLMHSERPYGGSWTTPDTVDDTMTDGAFTIFPAVVEDDGDRFITLRYADGFDSTNEMNLIIYNEFDLTDTPAGIVGQWGVPIK